jgi:dihydropteroate synthase
VQTAGDASRHLDRLGADADPETTVTRVLEFTDLSGMEQDALASLATTGPGVEIASGEDGTLVFGTVAALRAVSRESDGELSARFGAALGGFE